MKTIRDKVTEAIAIAMFKLAVETFLTPKRTVEESWAAVEEHTRITWRVAAAPVVDKLFATALAEIEAGLALAARSMWEYEPVGRTAPPGEWERMPAYAREAYIERVRAVLSAYITPAILNRMQPGNENANRSHERPEGPASVEAGQEEAAGDKSYGGGDSRGPEADAIPDHRPPEGDGGARVP